MANKTDDTIIKLGHSIPVSAFAGISVAGGCAIHGTPDDSYTDNNDNKPDAIKTDTAVTPPVGPSLVLSNLTRNVCRAFAGMLSISISKIHGWTLLAFGRASPTR